MGLAILVLILREDATHLDDLYQAYVQGEAWRQKVTCNVWPPFACESAPFPNA
jgi:hypothetical protein